MTKPHRDLDRSVAFTILLDVWPGYATSIDDGTGREITSFLADWYESEMTDMYAFAQQWAQGKEISAE